MNYWLMKTEGACYSIDDLKRDKKTAWGGVRNYQARNFMMSMDIGDKVLIYHSSSTSPLEPNGIYGLGKVVTKVHPDMTALNKKDEHYDPKSTKEKPIWYCVDVGFVKKYKKPLSLESIKRDEVLKHMVVAKKGIRLSIMPVSEIQFNRVVSILDA